ncbi:MAG: YidC/Oxa1 family membrane protein insertase [Eubacteriales bacterium]
MGNIFDIINIPLGYALKFFYELTSSYGVTLFLFAVIVKLLLFPFGIKTQKNSVQMAKLKPKEQAIRKKYAGRTDKVTQQKLNEEIMALYKEENYNVMGGCLPLLIQMPIIFALYNIIRNPLTYISGLSADVVTPIIDKAKELLGNANIDQITALTAIEAHPTDFAALLPAGFEPINFKILGGLIDLSVTPSADLWSPLIIIPLLNLVLSFLSMRITRKLTFQPSMAPGGANGADPTAATNKLMDFTMPLLTLYMGYTINAAVGLYWIFQTGLSIVQSFLLYKMFPIPKITEAEYAAAEEKYGKKKKKRTDDTIEGQYKDTDEKEGSGIAGSLSMGEMKDTSGAGQSSGEDSEEDDRETGLSDHPKGISPAVKSNYQKTGKKYNVKKKK